MADSAEECRRWAEKEMSQPTDAKPHPPLQRYCKPALTWGAMLPGPCVPCQPGRECGCQGTGRCLDTPGPRLHGTLALRKQLRHRNRMQSVRGSRIQRTLVPNAPKEDQGRQKDGGCRGDRHGQSSTMESHHRHSLRRETTWAERSSDRGKRIGTKRLCGRAHCPAVKFR
jgi:hypothetical protein